MSAEHGPASPDPDDFDRQLRDITSGIADEPRFTEPSAAERAKQAARRAKAGRATKPSSMSWRSARRARKLRQPVDGPRRSGRQRLRPAGRPVPRTPAQRRLRSAAKTIGILVAFAALVFVLHMLGFGPH
jgi:hypothetical protein